MSYGIQVYDSLGRIRLSEDGTVTRIIGSFQVNILSLNTNYQPRKTFVPVAGMSRRKNFINFLYEDPSYANAEVVEGGFMAWSTSFYIVQPYLVKFVVYSV